MAFFPNRYTAGSIPSECISVAAKSRAQARRFAKLDSQVVHVRGRRVAWPIDVHSINWGGGGPVMNVCFKDFVVVAESIRAAR